VLLAGVVEVNAIAQGALQQFTQWLWIEHPTFQLGGGHITTELLLPKRRVPYRQQTFTGSFVTKHW